MWRTAASDIEPSPCALQRLKTRVRFCFCASLSRCAIDACAAPLADDLADASTSGHHSIVQITDLRRRCDWSDHAALK